MVGFEKWSNLESNERLGIAILVAVAYGMILSDCFEFFGSWITGLKYLALGIMASYLIYKAAKELLDY